jgi:peptide/nickel transport system permease protein
VVKPGVSRWVILGVLAVTPLLLSAIGNSVGPGPYAIETTGAYVAPTSGHPFGTDGLGRDLLARTISATGLSLRVVQQSVVLSFFLALALGGLAGYFQGRWLDTVVTWTISLLFTIPFILIVVAVFAVAEPSLDRAYLVIGCIGWAAPARIVREEVIRVRASQFVLAERAYGYSDPRILAKSILPVCSLPAFLSLLYFVPELIGLEVGLSFFGLGADPPTPTLGGLIYNGLSEFSTGWWLPVMPALSLLAATSTVIALSSTISHRR